MPSVQAGFGPVAGIARPRSRSYDAGICGFFDDGTESARRRI